MRRREFVTLIGGAAAAWPGIAGAQQPERLRRIAVLMGSATTELGKSYLATFLRRLEQLGWSEGRNARFEVRWWTGGPEEMRPVVAELLAFSPDVIMVFSNLALALLKPMAETCRSCSSASAIRSAMGLSASLGAPGGNITGFAGTDGPIGGKWLEVLKETAPHLHPRDDDLSSETPIHQAFWRSVEAAAPRFGVEVTPGGVHDAAEIERTMSSFATKAEWRNHRRATCHHLGEREAPRSRSGCVIVSPSHYATAAPSGRRAGLLWS